VPLLPRFKVVTALQERPEIPDPVGMNVSVNVFPQVVHHLMRVFVFHLSLVAELVRVDDRSVLQVRGGFGPDGSVLAITDDRGPNALRFAFTGTFEDAHNNGLVARVRTAALPLHGSNLPVLVHVPRFATDEGFVNRDFAVQIAPGKIVLHRKTDSVRHEPCGLPGHAKSAVEFPRRNSIAVIRDHPNGRKPLIQTKKRIFKQGSGLERKLLSAHRALPDSTGPKKHRLIRSAVSASHAFGSAGIDRFVKRKVDISK
jgi:hypothetical protein